MDVDVDVALRLGLALGLGSGGSRVPEPSAPPGTDRTTVCLCVYGSCRLILIQVPPNMISVSSAFQL